MSRSMGSLARRSRTCLASVKDVYRIGVTGEREIARLSKNNAVGSVLMLVVGLVGCLQGGGGEDPTSSGKELIPLCRATVKCSR